MDPLKALADLDQVIQQTPADRKAHAHLIRCVETIKEALTRKPSE